MNPNELLEYDDLGEALREGRALRPARGYRILFAQGDLNFRSLQLTDPVPIGRQILASAGLDPRDGYNLFGILPSGDFEDVRLDELFDLRARGAERFVAFLTDRIFKLTVNDAQLEWGRPAISGAVLYGLAKPEDGEAVFLDVPGDEDRLIEPADLIDLTKPGISCLTGGAPWNDCWARATASCRQERRAAPRSSGLREPSQTMKRPKPS